MKTKLFTLLITALVAGSMMAEDAQMSKGSNSFSATVNGKTAIKLGSAKGGGEMSIQVGSYATTLNLYIVGWTGTSGTCTITTPSGVSHVSVTANSNISGDSNEFHLSNEDDYAHSLTLHGDEGSETIYISSSDRCVVWGATYSATIPTIGTEIDGFWYNFDSSNSTATVTYQGKYYSTYSNEYSGSVVIPASVTYNGKNYTVTSIGDYAFTGCTGLTSVTIPSSVKSIGKYVFSGCTGLTSVTIPNSVKSMGDNVFGECTGLTSVTIGSSITSIGNSAFYNCRNLTSVTIGNSVTNIEKYAFSGCSSLTFVTIPNSVTSIGERAFYGCGITSVTIGNSVTNIGYLAFSGCGSLTSVTINSILILNHDYNNSSYVKYIFGNQVTSYIIGDNITSIGGSAFRDCTGLASVTIPNSVTSIGGNAFSGCTGLTSVTIPNSVTSIGNWAFYGCTNLTHVTIPNSVTSIGSSAFDGCSGLTSVTIGNSVTNIGNGAFYNCSSLTSVTIPSSIKSIGGYAFYNCSSLTSVTIPSNVTNIGSHAFYECSGLTSVTITGGVSSIGEEAFASCAKLTEVIAAVKSIGKGAFKNGNRLRKILLGENVETFEEGAFANCPYLLEVYAKMEFPPVIDASIFEGCGDLSGIDCYVPEASMALYKKTAVWKEFQLHSMKTESVTVQAYATNGKVEGTGNYEINTDVVLTVIPNDGYSFKQWSDGNTSNPRTIFVTQDTILNAICEPTPVESLLFNEPFSANIGGFTIKDVTLDGVDYVWKWASANYGMKASAYMNNTNHTAESWLISPAISLLHTTNIVLSFDHAVNKGTPNNLRVKISTDSGASWNDLNVPNWPTGNNWNFVSTSLSLDAYADKNVQIAFVYKSTTSDCPTWEIKNFSVIGTVHQSEDVDIVLEESNNSITNKILRNGQILIQRGDKLYTLQGQEVR